MAVYGYMRVSTKKQETALQRDALLRYGVPEENLFSDIISGRSITRKGIDAAFKIVQRGDELVFWSIDRAGRDASYLLAVAKDMAERGVIFKSLTQPHDTTTPEGRLQFTIFCGIAQYEREVIVRRIKAGIKAKMDAGRPTWGRRPGIGYSEAEVMRLVRESLSYREIGDRLGISKSTVQRVIERDMERDVA